MHVRLTRGMVARIDDLVPDAARDELSVERDFYGKRTVTIHAAFVAWVVARDALAEDAFSPGRKDRNVNASTRSALQKVAAATNTVIKHPALRTTAMIGHHAHTFPVWELPEPDEVGRRWWPSPIEGARFVVLKPTWHSENSSRLTTWSPDGMEHRADRLNEEAVHWRVLGVG